MKSQASGGASDRFGFGWMRVRWRRSRRFIEQRSPYAITASLLIIANFAFGIQQWAELRTRGADLRQTSTQLDAGIAQSKAELAALSNTPRLSTSHSQRPALSQQGRLLADLQKQLQHKDVNTSDVVFSAPLFDKERAWWQQDTTVKLSGTYAAVTDLLTGIPRALNNVALISVKLSREATAAGQVECEAVLRAYFADDGSGRATPP